MGALLRHSPFRIAPPPRPSPSLGRGYLLGNGTRRHWEPLHENHPPDHGAGRGAVSGQPAQRARRQGCAAVRRRVGDLRAWQCRRHRRGAVSRAGHAADLPRAQRAGDGAQRDRVRQGGAAAADDGLHHLDRPRRHQHGDGGGGGACRPAAGAAAARRHLRQPAARSGAAAGRGFRRRHRLRQRLLQAGVALFRPHPAAGADPDRPAPRPAGADRSGGMRAGHALHVPGRAGRGLRLPRGVLRRACVGPAPDRAGSRRAGARRLAPQARQEAVHRVGRRRALFRSGEGAGGFRGEARHPGRRDPGRQVGAVDPAQAEHGLDRRDRQQRRQRAGAGSGCGARHRHAAAGFHHRIARAVPQSGAQDHQPQRPGVRCRQAWRHPAGDRRARRHRRGRQGAGRLVGAGRLAEAGGSGAQDLDRRTCRGDRGAQSRPAVGRRGDRRGAARGQAERHRGRRVGRPAGRTAQAVAVRRAGRLSPGIRLFLHGLRDRRRHRREDGRPGARGRRHARRRLIPDDEFGDRDLRHDGPEADHRAAGQSRLRLHQPAAARDRRRELQQPAAARQARDPAGDRLRGARQEHGREGRESVEHGRAGSGDGPRAQGGPHQRHRDRDRSLQDHRGRRLLVGRRRAGSVGAPESARRPQGLREINHIAARWRLESHECPFRRQSDWLVE